MEKNSKSHRNLDLGPTMPIIELDRDIFIYIQPIQISHTHTHTHTKEYSIVVCNNVGSEKTLKEGFQWSDGGSSTLVSLGRQMHI